MRTFPASVLLYLCVAPHVSFCLPLWRTLGSSSFPLFLVRVLCAFSALFLALWSVWMEMRRRQTGSLGTSELRGHGAGLPSCAGGHAVTHTRCIAHCSPLPQLSQTRCGSSPPNPRVWQYAVLGPFSSILFCLFCVFWGSFRPSASHALVAAASLCDGGAGLARSGGILLWGRDVDGDGSDFPEIGLHCGTTTSYLRRSSRGARSACSSADSGAFFFSSYG